jgi:very-short-patch-repair endonuclease
MGLKCSVGNNIVTKKDLLNFLGVTQGKLNNRLKKCGVQPIALNREQRQAIGSTASHINGYPIEEGVKAILDMDSVPGIALKEKLFGHLGIFAKPSTCPEVQWEAKLSEAFEGMEFKHNYQMGPYRVDFLIGSSKVVLECNGYEHQYYNSEREQQREQFITKEYGLVRFHHGVSLEKVINAILRIKPGEVIRLDVH